MIGVPRHLTPIMQTKTSYPQSPTPFDQEVHDGPVWWTTESTALFPYTAY
ncbi:hypothetical protein JMJ77_0013217 [Colletotrichum scovillei]|uniref:Uncharacterized protein n=1 Tax=Colletotrichum scovillei TaxID=1209932 RepID=A0A9P7R598_9PEZI|nr:hypothetical protein JMJ77_0013217 [Colletotrichum scovillei]KAG7069511.1 hypothetical protein JMJ76_0003179 [Colletotrichum scovillei]KAG7073458.1 hypothetical protein JMJ78_0014432 [Colletotrichum scovillei]